MAGGSGCCVELVAHKRPYRVVVNLKVKINRPALLASRRGSAVVRLIICASLTPFHFAIQSPLPDGLGDRAGCTWSPSPVAEPGRLHLVAEPGRLHLVAEPGRPRRRGEIGAAEK